MDFNLPNQRPQLFYHTGNYCFRIDLNYRTAIMNKFVEK